MTAQDAKKLTEISIPVSIERDFQSEIDWIKKYAQSGKFKANSYTLYRSKNRTYIEEKLKSLGYIVEEYPELDKNGELSVNQNRGSVSISWE